MATLDALYRITARPVGFQQVETAIRGVQRVGQDASKALGGIGNILGSVTGGVAALGVGLSAAGVAAFAKNAIDAADNMRDMSQRTGVSVEMLSKFRAAADMGGTSIEVVSKNMERLSKGLYSAGESGNATTEALQRLGLSATDSTGNLKNADQVLLEVADKFKAMPDGVEKTALAIQLFGKAGAEIIPMLNEGRQAIEGLNAKMSTEFANKADAYNDSLSAMGAVFGQIGVEIAGQLLPYLSSAVDWLTKVGVGFRDYIVANREPIRQTIEVIGKVGQSLGPWVVGITALVTAYNLLSTAVKAATVAKAALIAMTGPRGWALLAGAAVAAGAAVYGLNQATQAAGSSANQAALEAQKLASEFGKVAPAGDGIGDSVREAKQEQRAFNAAIQQSNMEYELMAATITATGQAIELNNKLADATLNADIAVNNAAKSILQTKLGQAKTEGEKMQITKQIMELDLQNAALQKQAAEAQINAEVTIADLKRRSAWQELRKAQAAIATAAAHKQDTREMKYQLELAKQAANAADREFILAGKIANERLRVADAQYQATVFQARDAIQRVNSIGTSYSTTNPAGGSVAGQQYRTIRLPSGGSITEMVPAFAGGGYTGDAPRSGGLDGRGGFMAMLHPRETVIDHGRGGAGGPAPSITIPIQTGPVYRLSDGTDTVSIADLHAAMQATAKAILGSLGSPGGRMALRGA